MIKGIFVIVYFHHQLKICTCSLLLLVLVISAQLNNAIRRSRQENWPFGTHTASSTNCSLEYQGLLSVHSDHKPLENIFKHSKDSASRHLQSILFSAVHSLFNIAGIFRPHCWHPFSSTTSRNSIGTSPRGIGIPPGEGTPVYRPYIYLPRNRVRFLRFSVLKKGIFLPCFSCVPGVVLKPGS